MSPSDPHCVPFPWYIIIRSQLGPPPSKESLYYDAYNEWAYVITLETLEKRIEGLKDLLIAAGFCVPRFHPKHEQQFQSIMNIGNQYLLGLFRSAPFRLWPNDWYKGDKIARGEEEGERHSRKFGYCANVSVPRRPRDRTLKSLDNRDLARLGIIKR